MARIGDLRQQSELVEARARLMTLLREKRLVPGELVPEFLGRLEALIDAKISDAADRRY